MFIGIVEARHHIFNDIQLASRCYKELDFSALDLADKNEKSTFFEYIGRLGLKLQQHGLFEETTNLLVGDIPPYLHAAAGGRLGMATNIILAAAIVAPEENATRVTKGPHIAGYRRLGDPAEHHRPQPVSQWPAGAGREGGSMSTKPSYLDTFPAVSPGRPLVIPVSPQPGEGLPDSVLRAASVNSYTATSTILLVAGLSGRYAAGVATNAIGHEEELSRTLGVAGGKETIVKLVYEPVSGRPGWHMFFDTPMRIAHREVLRRRVSPMALRRSNHARAIWSVKVFSFDPETKECLLDKCPECGSWLSYGLSYGVNCCGVCLGEDGEGVCPKQGGLSGLPAASR